MSCHSLLACRVSAERSAVNLMWIALCVISCFSLAPFNIFTLYLIFDNLINMCLGLFLLGFSVWDSPCFLDLINYFLSHIKEVSNYNLFKYFIRPFFFLFFFWDPYNSNVAAFKVVPMVCETVLSSVHSFYLFCSVVVISTILPSRSLIRSSASVILLLFPSIEFLISLIVLFMIVCLLFSSCRSLLNISCTFSILFPRFWIIFTIITLNYFSGRLPFSSSFVCSGGFLPCSFICCVFLCLLILLNLLFLGSPFHRLQVRSSRCFWCLSPVAKVGSVCCVCFQM